MTAPKRMRRTPEDARRVILDAAEAAMAEAGPAGIRLQDVAKAAGVSHPLILHHFGSREGLIRALNLRTVEDLKTVLLGTIGSSETSADSVVSAFAAYRSGLARRMVWMLDTPVPQGAAGLPMFNEIVAALHAVRLRLAAPGAVVEAFDSRAIVHLVTIAAFGDALIGPRIRQAATPAEDAAQRQRFEQWFSGMLNGYVMSAANPVRD